MATKSARSTGSRSRASRSTSPRPASLLDQPITFGEAAGKLKYLGGLVIGLSAVAAAWVYLEWPVPATRGYVDTSVGRVVTRIDGVDALGLRNRIETLKGRKGQLDQERVALELQLKQTKDPVAVQIIANRRQAMLDETSEVAKAMLDAEDQIRRLNGIISSTNHKNGT